MPESMAVKGPDPKQPQITGRVKKLTRLEEEAVQAEDFEAAAGHSADLDAAQQLVQKLQQDLRQAEDQLAAMVRSLLFVAVQQ